MALWDAATGARVGSVFPAEPDVPMFAEFGVDSRTVRISSPVGNVYSWDTTPSSWVDFACHVAGRNMTSGEWRDTCAEEPYRETCPDA